MNSPFVTNLLLMIVAVLLLVLVVQNGMHEGTYVPQASNPHRSMQTPSQPMPSSTSDMDHSMFFQALSGFPKGCNPKLTLAECSTPAAEAVKNEILSIAEERGPREVFDYVINKYGMAALTEQAQQIRRSRTGQ